MKSSKFHLDNSFLRFKINSFFFFIKNFFLIGGIFGSKLALKNVKVKVNLLLGLKIK